VVHNGIIENFRELREELTAKGHVFATETDSEAVAHLVAEEMRHGSKPREAVAAALGRLKGAFALVFLFDGELDLLIGARRGSRSPTLGTLIWGSTNRSRSFNSTSPMRGS